MKDSNKGSKIKIVRKVSLRDSINLSDKRPAYLWDNKLKSIAKEVGDIIRKREANDRYERSGSASE